MCWASTCRSADSYLSLHESADARWLEEVAPRVNIHYIESTDIEQHGTHASRGVWMRFWCLVVSDERGIEGRSQAVRYAREQGAPYLGISSACRSPLSSTVATCWGSADRKQDGVQSRTPYPVIAMISEWQDQAVACTDANPKSRPRARPCPWCPGQLLSAPAPAARDIFAKDIIMERHLATATSQQ